MKQISKLQYITTNAQLAESACRGGVDWIQLRLKNIDYEEYRNVALQVKEVCKKYNAALIINDNVQLAKEIEADGVHIGQNDMPPQEARDILGKQFIIGCTANTSRNVIQLSESPIDYIGLGPFRFTTTKEQLGNILGIAGYSRILESLKEQSIKARPIVAIGGITTEDIAGILLTGLHGVAISGAISNDLDVERKAREFKNLVELYSKKVINE